MTARGDNLHLDLSSATLDKARSTKSKDVAESWEDEDIDMNTPTASDTLSPLALQTTSSITAPGPPPPTPISPAGHQGYDWSAAGVLGGGRPTPRAMPGQNSGGDIDRRPEKTTAAASRMIAAGLGVRAPKKTEEQRQYDRAVKEQEIKRKNREKEEQEKARLEDERAKAAVWGS